MVGSEIALVAGYGAQQLGFTRRELTDVAQQDRVVLECQDGVGMVRSERRLEDGNRALVEGSSVRQAPLRAYGARKVVEHPAHLRIVRAHHLVGDGQRLAIMLLCLRVPALAVVHCTQVLQGRERADTLGALHGDENIERTALQRLGLRVQMLLEIEITQIVERYRHLERVGAENRLGEFDDFAISRFRLLVLRKRLVAQRSDVQRGDQIGMARAERSADVVGDHFGDRQRVNAAASLVMTDGEPNAVADLLSRRWVGCLLAPAGKLWKGSSLRVHARAPGDEQHREQHRKGTRQMTCQCPSSGATDDPCSHHRPSM